jgi:hypothetical protein
MGTIGRDAFPGLGPVSKVPPSSAPPLRAKLKSIEEISSSLLLSDDSTIETAALAPGTGVEELSGSMLLEDPDDTGEQAAAPGTGRNAAPATARAHDTMKPALAPDTLRPASNPHRALLGMPELPTSTPAPDLSALPGSMLPDAMLRPLAPPTEPLSFEVPPARDTPSSLPTTIAWPSPFLAQAPAVAEPPPETVADQEPAVDPPPAETDGPFGGVGGDMEVHSLPRSSLRVAKDSLSEGLRRLRGMANSADARPRWFLPAIGFVGLVVGGSIALAVSLVRRGGETGEAQGSASAHAEVSTGAPVPSSRSQVAPPVACKVAGAPRVVAKSGTLAAGIEVRALGDEVALGFAADDHLASGMRLDPGSLSVTTTLDTPSTDPIRRVTAVLSGAEPAGKSSLALAVDTDRSGDSLQGRRTVPLPAPLELGASGGGLGWAHPGAAAAGKLWPLEGDGEVEAIRGAVESTGDVTTTAIALRHANAIWLGTATGKTSLAPQGPLARIDGLGTGVGQPAMAISDSVVLAAWADRASADDPWRLRWVRFKAGEAPGAPGTFTPPAGGQGEQALSPGLAAVPGGRFLLVWTEGPKSRHDVRALTLSREGQPIGAPLVISNRGVNSGQGQAAVNEAQKGLVAFLQSAGAGFEVVATPIACGM